jgi:superkiller protein 3
LDSFLAQYPENLYALSLKAELCANKKEYRKSRHYLGKKIKHYPSNINSYAQLGIILFSNLHEFEEGKKYIETALSLDDNDPRFHLAAALIYNLEDAIQYTDLNKAIWHLEKSIQLETSEITYLMLAKTQVACGKTDKAIDCYKRILELNPVHEESNSQLAKLLNKKGLNTEAATYFKKIVEFDPSNKDAIKELINFYKGEGLFLTTEEYCIKFLEIDPNDSEVNYLLGTIYSIDLKNSEKALYYFLRASEVTPIKEPVYFNIAVLQEQEFNNPKAAEVYYKRNLALFPDDVATNFRLASLYIVKKFGDSEEIRRYLMKVIEVEPFHEGALLALAYMTEYIDKNPEAAFAYHEKILLANPNNITSNIAVGKTLLKRDAKDQKGENYLRKALELGSKDSNMFFILAYIDLMSDRKETAKSFYEKSKIQAVIEDDTETLSLINSAASYFSY